MFFRRIIALPIFCFLLSIKGLAYTNSSDSLQIVQFINKAFSIRQSYPDSALKIVQKGLLLAETSKDTQNLINLWRIKGLVHYGQHKMELALTNFEKSYAYAEKINHGKSRLLINLGNTYYQQQAYELAAEKYEKALSFNSKKDTLLSIDAINNLGSVCISTGKFEQAIAYYKQSLALQKTIGKLLLQTYINMAQTYNRMNQLEKSIETYEVAENLAAARSDTSLLVIIYQRMGTVYNKKGAYVTSIQIFQKALDLQKLTNDQRGIANTLQGMGIVFYEQKDFPTSLTYLNHALEIGIAEKDYLRQQATLDFIGHIYQKQLKFSQALTAFQKAKQIIKQQGFKKSLMYPLSSIGDTYERLNQLDSASFYLNQANKLAQKYNQNNLKASIQISLGKIAQRKKKFKTALRHFRKAIEAAKAEGHIRKEAEASKLLADLLMLQKKDSEALFHLNRYLGLKDSLFNEETTKKLVQLEANYQFEKEKQDLIFQNEVEKQILDNEIQRQRIWQIALGLGLVLSLLALFFYIRFQRLNAQVSAQQLEYEQKERERLTELNTFKSRFFTNIAHELRTPLTLILGPVNRLLKNNIQEAPQQPMLQLIEEYAHLLLGRVNEILDLAKIDSNTVDLQPTPTDFYEFTQKLINKFADQAKQKSQELRLNYQLEKGTNILVDQSKFQHVFNNYLSNALKFTPRGGQITIAISAVEASTQTPSLLLEVKDNGRGIPEKDLPFIFDRFYQSDANKVNYVGAGIGLALSKEIATLMQGKVGVKSQWGVGSVFSFQFPLAIVESTNSVVQEKESVTKSYFSENGPTNTIKSATILIVEDNPQLNNYLQFILGEKYQVIAAKNGKVALEKLKSTSCDLILSDIMMPIMDGFDLLKHLKKSDKYCHLPFIMLTAKVGQSDKLKALRIGVDDYLIKPFEEEVLFASIQHLLSNQSNRTAKVSSEKETPNSTTNTITNADLQWLEKVETILKQELSNSQFTFDQLANQLFISRSQLQRRLKKITGLPPNKYYREIRLQSARKLLSSGDMRTISEVTYAVGFETPKYFVKIYQERFGKYPKVDL